MKHAAPILTAAYDLRLVTLSYLVAVLASYTALDVAGRVTAARGRSRVLWLASGTFAMGIGIWSMHFTGMLAFSLPVAVTYSVPIVLVSVLPAIAASGLALFVVSRPQFQLHQLLSAGVVMGLGIAAMHYSGMYAMRMAAMSHYNPFLFAASVLIAIGASTAALWLAFHLRNAYTIKGLWLKVGAALVMAVAIVGMHFTGMAAASFTATESLSSAAHPAADNIVLAIGIALATLIILGLTLLSSLIDRRFSAQSTALATSELRYQSLFMHNPDAVYSLDLAGHFVSINPVTTTLTGFQEHELLHTPFLSLTVPEHTVMARHSFERALQGEPQEYDIAVTHKEGRRVEWSITNLPIMVNEQIVGVYGIAKDITQRKQVELALQQNEAHLRTVQQQLLDTIQALSTPVLPIHDQILVLPLIGSIDSARSKQLMETLLVGVELHRAKLVLVDVTGVPVIDAAVANHLLQATQAVRLLGAQVVLVGMSPTIAQTLVQLGVDLRSLTTYANLASGLQYALKQSRIPVHK